MLLLRHCAFSYWSFMSFFFQFQKTSFPITLLCLSGTLFDICWDFNFFPSVYFPFLLVIKSLFFFHFKTTKFILSQESTVSVISGWEDIPSLVPHITLPFPFSMDCCSSLNPSISYTGIMAMSVNTDQWTGNLENRFISVISYTNVLWEVNNAGRFRQI